MRVGVVKYLNALPYHFQVSNNQELVLNHPSILNQLLERHELDSALTSSIMSFKDEYDLLPFGVASEGEVLSVNLYVKKELKAGTIALSPFSATSNALLKILCKHFWKVAPRFVTLHDPHDGFLLIGDEALNYEREGYTRIDLGKSWWEFTQLPFVFALFMVRKGVCHQGLGDLERALEASLKYFESNRETLIEKAAQNSSFSSKVLEKYFGCLRYRLNQREFEGLKLFRELHVQ